MQYWLRIAALMISDIVVHC